MDEPVDARAALGAVADAEGRLADHLQWPLWRHAVVGGLLGLVLLGQTMPSRSGMVMSGLVVILTLLVIRSDKKRHGVFVSGYRKGRTGWIALALGAVAVAAIIFVRTHVSEPMLEQPLFWLVFVALTVGSTLSSLLWQRVYRAELSGGARK